MVLLLAEQKLDGERDDLGPVSTTAAREREREREQTRERDPAVARATSSPVLLVLAVVFVLVMERITLVERVTFTPLFDWCVGRWKEDARQAKDAAALIQFFVQFAKDVQGGSQCTDSGREQGRDTRTHTRSQAGQRIHSASLHSLALSLSGQT